MGGGVDGQFLPGAAAGVLGDAISPVGMVEIITAFVDEVGGGIEEDNLVVLAVIITGVDAVLAGSMRSDHDKTAGQGAFGDPLVHGDKVIDAEGDFIEIIYLV